MATFRERDQQADTSLNFGDTVLVCIKGYSSKRDELQYLYRSRGDLLNLCDRISALPNTNSAIFRLMPASEDNVETYRVCFGNEIQIQHVDTNNVIAIDYSQSDSDQHMPPVYLKGEYNIDSIFRVVSHSPYKEEGDKVLYREQVILEAAGSTRHYLIGEFHQPDMASNLVSSEEAIVVSYQPSTHNSMEHTTSNSSLGILHNNEKVYVSSHKITFTPIQVTETMTEAPLTIETEASQKQNIGDENQSNSIGSHNSTDNAFQITSTLNPSTETLLSDSIEIFVQDEKEENSSSVHEDTKTEDTAFSEESRDVGHDKIISIPEMENQATVSGEPKQPRVPIVYPKHEKTAQGFITQLKSHIDPKLKAKQPKSKSSKIQTLEAILTQLQTELSTVPGDPWVKDFLEAPNNGHDVLIDLIRDLTEEQAPVEQRKNKRKQSTVHERNTESIDAALLCLKALIKHEQGLAEVVRSYFSSHVLVNCLYTQRAARSAKILALEVLTTFLQSKEARDKVIQAFDHFRTEKKEKTRFELLLDTLPYGAQQGHLSYQVAMLRFINAVVQTAEGLNERVFHQQQFIQAGFKPQEMENSLADKVDDDPSVREIRKWNKLFINVQQCVDDLEKYKLENEQLNLELLLAKKQLEEATKKCDLLEKDNAHLGERDKILRDELKQAQNYLHKAKLDRQFLHDQTKELMWKVDSQNPEDLRRSPLPWEHRRHY